MMVASSKYELIRPIASGGMATVYLGRVVRAGGFQRLVAIKRMHPHLSQNTDFVSMFLDEARLAASIHHPNVVGTIDIEESVEGLSLVMEFIDGTSLYKLYAAARKEDSRVPLPIALRVLLDSCAGLQAAHDLLTSDGHPLNLVHRDISPQNILVGVDGVSRITDFGVARAEERLTATSDGSMKGKLSYMSPEQLRGDNIDRQADVYSLGVVLWELLAGRRLFSAESGAATVSKVLKGANEPPSQYTPGIPAAIDVVVMTSLLPREARYASANDFAEAIENAAAQAGIQIASARQVAELVKVIAPPVAVSVSGPISVAAPLSSGSLPHQHTGPMMQQHSYAIPHAGGTGSGSLPSASGVAAIPSLTAMNQNYQPAIPHPPPPSSAMGGVLGGIAVAVLLVAIGGGAGIAWMHKNQATKGAATTATAPVNDPPPPPAPVDPPPPNTAAVTPPPPATAATTEPATSASTPKNAGSHSSRPPATHAATPPPPAPAPAPAPAPGPNNKKFHPLDP